MAHLRIIYRVIILSRSCWVPLPVRIGVATASDKVQLSGKMRTLYSDRDLRPNKELRMYATWTFTFQPDVKMWLETCLCPLFHLCQFALVQYVCPLPPKKNRAAFMFSWHNTSTQTIPILSPWRWKQRFLQKRRNILLIPHRRRIKKPTLWGSCSYENLRVYTSVTCQHSKEERRWKFFIICRIEVSSDFVKDVSLKL